MEKQHYLDELEQLLRDNNEPYEDIQKCIDYAANLIDLGLPVIFDKRHFSLLVGTTVQEITYMAKELEKVYYTETKIPKKSGGYRQIQIPAMRLRIIQRWILHNILNKIRISDHAMGFAKDRSIVTNALPHVGKECVVNIDIKDFFPTITQEQVFRIFYYYGYTTEVSYILSRLCTVGGTLPQGAPTSPYLSNIVCLRLDKRLASLANSYDASYTRYADDMSFSGKYGVQNIVKAASRIIEDEGFTVNRKKTRVLFKYQKQTVTGINVSGGKVSVEKKYLKRFLQEIYYCKKYGVMNHLSYIHCNKHFYKEHLYGKAYYIKMVDQKLGENVLALLDEIDWDY